MQGSPGAEMLNLLELIVIDSERVLDIDLSENWWVLDICVLALLMGESVLED